MKHPMITLALATTLALGLAACGAKESDRTAGQKVDTAIANTQVALENAGQKTAAVVEDASITTSIKTDLLKDPELSAIKIEVETLAGVVTLNGVAPTEGAVERAGRIAIAVKGVTEVRNHVVARKG